MSNCINLKQKLDRTLYCKELKKVISINQCTHCQLKKFKQNKTSNSLKKISFKRNKAQKERFSIINHPLDKCAVCGSKNGVQLNEVYEGAKRGVSMKYGFVVPLCDKHHKRFHKDRTFAIPYKQIYQREFEKTHTREEFLNLIHHNYL